MPWCAFGVCVWGGLKADELPPCAQGHPSLVWSAVLEFEAA